MVGGLNSFKKYGIVESNEIHGYAVVHGYGGVGALEGTDTIHCNMLLANMTASSLYS
jgi:hypothetical protein